MKIQTFSAGEVVPGQVSSAVEARRGDGSAVLMREVTSPAGERGEAIEIVDLTRRRIVRVEPFTGSKTTTALSAAEVLLHQMGADGCRDLDVAAATADLHSKRLGRNVVLALRGGSESVTQSDWVAPDLNCAAMESSSASADGWHEERAIVKVATSEPSEALFEVPAGLVERTAEEVAAAYRGKYGNTVLPTGLHTRLLGR